LVSRINLPGVVGVLGSLPGTTPRPTGWGWSQAVLAQPPLDGPDRGEFVCGIRLHQFHANAAATPVGVLAAQRDAGFQRQRNCRWARSTGVIAGLQGGGTVLSASLQRPTHQASDRAQRQVELPSDFRGTHPEAGHAIDS
jgi:hypothetical protein